MGGLTPVRRRPNPDHLPRGTPGRNIGRQSASGSIATRSERRAGLGERVRQRVREPVVVVSRHVARGEAERARRGPASRAWRRGRPRSGGRPRTCPAAGGPCRARRCRARSTLTGSCSWTAVASSCTLSSSEPSPVTHTTAASGHATCAPSAAGRPKPIVPRPPEVIQRRGRSKRSRLAAHIWCWPTSVVTIASPPSSGLERVERRLGAVARRAVRRASASIRSHQSASRPGRRRAGRTPRRAPPAPAGRRRRSARAPARSCRSPPGRRRCARPWRAARTRRARR